MFATLRLEILRERDQLETDISLTMKGLATKHQKAIDKSEKLTGKLYAVKTFKNAVYGERKSDGLGSKRSELLDVIAASGADIATLAPAFLRKSRASYGLYEVVGKLDALWHLKSEIEYNSGRSTESVPGVMNAENFKTKAMVLRKKYSKRNADVQSVAGVEVLCQLYNTTDQLAGNLNLLRRVVRDREDLAEKLQFRGSSKAEEVRPFLQAQISHTQIVEVQVAQELQRIDDILRVMRLRCEQLRVAVKQLALQKKAADKELRFHLGPCKFSGQLGRENPEKEGDIQQYWIEADEGNMVWRDAQGEADEDMLEMDLNGCVLTCLYDDPVRSAKFEPRAGWEAFWLTLKRLEHPGENSMQHSAELPPSRPTTSQSDRLASKSSARSKNSSQGSSRGSPRTQREVQNGTKNEEPPPEPTKVDGTWVCASKDLEDMARWMECIDFNSRYKTVVPELKRAAKEAKEALRLPERDMRVAENKYKATRASADRRRSELEALLNERLNQHRFNTNKLIIAKSKERNSAEKLVKKHHKKCDDWYGRKIWQNIRKNEDTRDGKKAFDRCRLLANDEIILQTNLESQRVKNKAHDKYGMDRMSNWLRIQAYGRSYMAARLGDAERRMVKEREPSIISHTHIDHYVDTLSMILKRNHPIVRKCGAQFLLGLALREHWRPKLAEAVRTVLHLLSSPEDTYTADCACALRIMAAEPGCRTNILSGFALEWVAKIKSVSDQRNISSICTPLTKWVPSLGRVMQILRSQ
eukprot:SAG11_NODE_152_length_14520_cov_49.681575_3_plen_755_part_00